MAQGEGDNPTSKGSLPGTNRPIPTLERHESLHAESNVPGFGAAFSRLAFTPTALGELAATVSNKAGMAFAERQGNRLGKTPEGDLLPAITPIDEAFVKSYSAQAEATLGLQAQQLMFKATEQLNQSYMLSPGQIADFHEKVGEGLQGILSHAPSTVRPAMENQYASQLMKSTHNLNMKMISEQKQVATQNSALFRKNQDIQMQNAIRDGNIDLASQIYQSIQSNVQSGLATHQLSPLQGDAALHSAKLNFYGTQEIQKAIEARKEHKLEPFLADMVAHKPANMGWDEWTKVQSMTMGAINQMENIDNRNQTLMQAQMKDDALHNELDANKIAFYKENLQPTRFLNSMAPLIASQKSTAASNQKSMALAAHGQDPAVWASANAKEKNSAFDMLVAGQIEDAQNKGVDLNESQAKVLVAKSLAGPVPKFIAELNLNGQSQNPILIAQASHSLDILDAQAGGNTSGVTELTRGTVEAYKHYKLQGYSDEDAGLMARNTTINKTEDQRKTNDFLVGQWNTKFANTTAKRNTFAKKFIHSGEGLVSNQDALNNQLVNTYKDYLKLFNGDENMASSMLQKGVDRAYGTTNINGVKQYTYFPAEKAIGLPAGATSLIQADVVNQLGPQLAGVKTAYDNGTSEFYYKIKDRVSIDDYMKARDEISKEQTLKGFGHAILSGRPVHLEKQYKIVDEFESGKPIELEKIYRNHPSETVKISVDSSPYMSITTDDNPMIGGYDINQQTASGRSIAIMGPMSGPLNPPVYRPNKNWIYERYFAVNNIQPDTRPLVEQAKELVKIQDEKATQWSKFLASSAVGH